MGYDSWAEWCDYELDGFKLPATERREAVVELADAGMSNRAIADALNVSRETVNRDVASPDTNVSPDREVTGQDGKTYSKAKSPITREDLAELHTDVFDKYSQGDCERRAGGDGGFKDVIKSIRQFIDALTSTPTQKEVDELKRLQKYIDKKITDDQKADVRLLFGVDQA